MPFWIYRDDLWFSDIVPRLPHSRRRAGLTGGPVSPIASVQDGPAAEARFGPVHPRTAPPPGPSLPGPTARVSLGSAGVRCCHLDGWLTSLLEAGPCQFLQSWLVLGLDCLCAACVWVKHGGLAQLVLLLAVPWVRGRNPDGSAVCCRMLSTLQLYRCRNEPGHR